VNAALQELTPLVGVRRACGALGVARATYYRRRPATPSRTTETAAVASTPEDPSATGTASPSPDRQPTHPRALSEAERTVVLTTLNSERFRDAAPAEVYATLLDEGVYLASTRTFYRVLKAAGAVGDRRAQRTHPTYARPELLATGPNEVWSWDITRLRGPARGTYFYLYVLLDIYSRYVPGWLVATRENAELAEAFLDETLTKQGIGPGRLTVHADRGAPMTAKPVAVLLSDLGVTRSHSRPHTSNDNPYSEAQFKTLKYRPDFPARFESLEAARAFLRTFFAWYNGEHRHSGIGYYTPTDVHFGQAEGRRAQRAAILERAYAAHPERFVRRAPQPTAVPTAAYINPPLAPTVANPPTLSFQENPAAVPPLQ
jgi:putative transposase